MSKIAELFGNRGEALLSKSKAVIKELTDKRDKVLAINDEIETERNEIMNKISALNVMDCQLSTAASLNANVAKNVDKILGN